MRKIAALLVCGSVLASGTSSLALVPQRSTEYTSSHMSNETSINIAQASTGIVVNVYVQDDCRLCNAQIEKLRDENIAYVVRNIKEPGVIDDMVAGLQRAGDSESHARDTLVPWLSENSQYPLVITDSSSPYRAGTHYAWSTRAAENTINHVAELSSQLAENPGNTGEVTSSPEKIAEMVNLINAYRKDKTNYNTNVDRPDGSLLESRVGDIELKTNSALMQSAQQTAEKFADGTYDYSIADPHNQTDPNGTNGPMVRAIKAGWIPSVNTIYNAGTTPPITGVRENLMQGPAGLSVQAALNQWKNSPGHNKALLLSHAHSMGVGHAESNGRSYWVFLIEAEAHIHSVSENSRFFFGNWFPNNPSPDLVYRVKPGASISPTALAADMFEISQEAIEKIKRER